MFDDYFPLSNIEFQKCHKAHLDNVLNTRAVEAAGRAIRFNNNSGIQQVREFSDMVFIWGGGTGSRVRPRVVNTDDGIVLNGFQNAIQAVNAQDLATNEKIRGAKECLATINGFGSDSTSYSSKHLRMLAPELFGVYDSLVEGHLKTYRPRLNRQHMFQLYSEYCISVAANLRSHNVALGDFLDNEAVGVQTSRIPAEYEWTAADIDMAIFAWLKGWCSTCNNPSNLTINRDTSAPPPKGISKVDIIGNRPDKNAPLYLSECAQHYIALRESILTLYNTAAIDFKDGCIDFKTREARGVNRYLKGELQAAGLVIEDDDRWVPSADGKTHHNGGSNWEGCLHIGNFENAVRFMCQHFHVVAHPNNQLYTQDWLGQLLND